MTMAKAWHHLQRLRSPSPDPAHREMEINAVSYQLQHALQLGGSDHLLGAPIYSDVPGLDFSGASQAQSSQQYYQAEGSQQYYQAEGRQQYY